MLELSMPVRRAKNAKEEYEDVRTPDSRPHESRHGKYKRDSSDVNTIVGDPVETPDGSVIMPISKVGFGFAAGGSEFVTDSEIEIEGGSMNRGDALQCQSCSSFRWR